MGRKIKEFHDGSFLEYDRGKFDDMCVYLNKSDGTRKPPKDVDYFSELKDLSEKFGIDKVYGDYVDIYQLTGKEVDPEVLQYITDISVSYGEFAFDAEVLYTVLYMAMISEENKAYSRLGKRIKRLGVYKILKENCDIKESANFMKGMKWRDIDVICKERGF